MAAPFAAIEARINAAVVSHLANATADFGSGVVVDGVYDADYGDPLGLVAGSSKVFMAESALMTSFTVGQALTLGGTSYTVAAIEPDGTGMTRLRLK